MLIRVLSLFTCLSFLSLEIAADQKHGNKSASSTFFSNGVTAHRGNSSEFPENTLPAFKSALELGVDWIELDIFLTKDDQLVVIHDKTTNRVGNMNVTVSDVTLEKLQSIDVATEFRKRTAKKLKECPPERVPLLKDVLSLVMKQQGTRVSIQPKMDCVPEAIELIKQMKAERWVGFNDGNLRYMADVKRLAPEIPVFWDRGASTEIEEDIRLAKQHGFESLVLHYSGVTPDKVQKVKAAGLEIGAWTVNDPSAMSTLLDMGVQRFYTDYPRKLLSLLQDR